MHFKKITVPAISLSPFQCMCKLYYMHYPKTASAGEIKRLAEDTS